MNLCPQNYMQIFKIKAATSLSNYKGKKAVCIQGFSGRIVTRTHASGTGPIQTRYIYQILFSAVVRHKYATFVLLSCRNPLGQFTSVRGP